MPYVELKVGSYDPQQLVSDVERLTDIICAAVDNVSRDGVEIEKGLPWEIYSHGIKRFITPSGCEVVIWIRYSKWREEHLNEIKGAIEYDVAREISPDWEVRLQMIYIGSSRIESSNP